MTDPTTVKKSRAARKKMARALGRDIHSKAIAGRDRIMKETGLAKEEAEMIVDFLFKRAILRTNRWPG